MYSYTPSLTSALGGGGWSTSCPGRFTPEKDPVPIVYKAEAWTGAENLAPTEMRSLERSARSDSLYRLGYRGPFTSHILGSNILDTRTLHIIPSNRPRSTPVTDFTICCEHTYGLYRSKNRRKDNTLKVNKIKQLAELISC